MNIKQKHLELAGDDDGYPENPAGHSVRADLLANNGELPQPPESDGKDDGPPPPPRP